MVILSVNLTIKPGNEDIFMPLVQKNAAASRAQAGCQQFEVLVDPMDRTRVLLFEIYDDQAAFATHEQSDHFKAYVAEAVPLLASRERHFWRREGE